MLLGVADRRNGAPDVLALRRFFVWVLPSACLWLRGLVFFFGFTFLVKLILVFVFSFRMAFGLTLVTLATHTLLLVAVL